MKSINCKISKLKLIFFVNGSEASAAGVRANTFADRLSPEWDIRFKYRPVPKWKGILPFIQSSLKFRPDIIYIIDVAL